MKTVTALALSALLLSGCATTPTGPGPSANVMPAKHKSLAAFTDDDTICRRYASGQVEGAATHANWMQAAVAGGGTILGAGLGAAIGGGRGAAIGAGAGALGGASVGGLTSAGDQRTLQQRYDVAYTQCQATRGNQVSGR
jgi:hypothetical protein